MADPEVIPKRILELAEKYFQEKLSKKGLDPNLDMVCHAGFSANLVALTAMTSPKMGERKLKPGDEVITGAARFPSTVTSLVQNQRFPVFVDVNLGDYTAPVAEIDSQDLLLVSLFFNHGLLIKHGTGLSDR